MNLYTDVIIDMTYPSQKIYLTEQDDLIESDDSYLSRNERNCLRITLAGGLSAGGSMLAGFLPTPIGIAFGGFINGIGNAVSTYLAWETKEIQVLEARILTDFPKVVAKAKAITEKLNHFIDRLEHDKEFIPDSEALFKELTSDDTENRVCGFYIGRHRRNFCRLIVASSLSAAGGLLAGFKSTTGGIVGGGILGGVGNAASTWLSYEQTHDATIKKRALTDLPEILLFIETQEKQLCDLMNRIESLNNLVLRGCSNEMQDKTFLQEPDDEPSTGCWKKTYDCLLGARWQRNITYIMAAGCMSATGGWLSGFWPHPAGIVLGSGFGSAANAISTWLAWENVDDKKIEKIVLNQFPQLVAKINEMAKKIILVSAYAEACELEVMKFLLSKMSSKNPNKQAFSDELNHELMVKLALGGDLLI